MHQHNTLTTQPSMRFIVHADDCGLTRHISDDIFACLAHGPLNSVSVIMGGSHTAASLQKLADMPHVRVCLHLNILEGHCSAPAHEVRLLVDENGIFRHGLGQMLCNLAVSAGSRNKALRSAIRHEFEAQIDAFSSSFSHMQQRGGLHLDGHLHIHTIPALRGIMAELIHEHSPAYVRIPKEPLHLPHLPMSQLLVGCARRALLTHWSSGFIALLNKMDVAHNNFLCGLVSGGNLSAARAEASLEAIQRQGALSPLVEIMCHPGGGQDIDHCVRHNSFYQSSARQDEKNMLLNGSLSNVLARYGTLCTFAELPLL